MAIWLIRAGKYGQYEQKFIQENRVYLTWDGLDVDLSQIAKKPMLQGEMAKYYPNEKPKAILNWTSQVWPFAQEMKPGDLAVIPLKGQPAIQIGEITGDYHFEPAGPDPFFHWRPVKWIGEAIPRANFGKDLLYSFGAFMTICRIQRNHAEARVEAMRANDWKPEAIAAVTKVPPSVQAAITDATTIDTDLEQLALDQIAQLIAARFKGHDLARLVEAILKAKGYSTYCSPEGPDGGVDILAGAPPLGFGVPRLAVEVKSDESGVQLRQGE